MKIKTRFLSLVAGALALTSASETIQEYDYVIIGSGPGGGSLAANLAKTNSSVFLLEAGGDASRDVYQRLPLLSASAAERAPNSWQFFVEHYANTTQAQRDLKYTYRLSNGSYHVGPNAPDDAEPLGVYYPRGATLGGSAQVNAMNLAWAPDNEWDYIADLTGDASWGHEEMRRHFVALENCSYVPRGTPGHGFEGYIESSLADPEPILDEENVARFIEQVFRESGDVVPESREHMAELMVRDINRIDSDRYAQPLMFLRPDAVSPVTHSRSGIADYINEVIEAGYPLTLSLHSLATRVILEGGGGQDDKPKAVGVDYLVGEGLYSADQRYYRDQESEIKTVRARKEVIVAGGTFNTPQILKLSGIGPREELEALDIPVRVDLPAVGHFMQDNYESALQVRAEEPWIDASTSPCTQTFNSSDLCYVAWETNGTGPYTAAGGSFMLTWRSSASWDQDADLFFLSAANTASTGFFPGYSQALPAPNYWTTSIVKMQTDNPSGSVTLRSRDPREAPEILFNYFAERTEEDLQALVEGAELLLRSYDALNISYTRIEPDPRIDMRQGIRDQTFSHHATSSCRMGRADDGGQSCVDSRFRVHGVSKLRVVDASVLPRVPGAFPNAPTFTISRKALEAIVEDDQVGEKERYREHRHGQ